MTLPGGKIIFWVDGGPKVGVGRLAAFRFDRDGGSAPRPRRGKVEAFTGPEENLLRSRPRHGRPGPCAGDPSLAFTAREASRKHRARSEGEARIPSSSQMPAACSAAISSRDPISGKSRATRAKRWLRRRLATGSGPRPHPAIRPGAGHYRAPPRPVSHRSHGRAGRAPRRPGLRARRPIDPRCRAGPAPAPRGAGRSPRRSGPGRRAAPRRGYL